MVNDVGGGFGKRKIVAWGHAFVFHKRHNAALG